MHLGIQSFSTLSYSHFTFNLSINLGNLLLPLAVFSTVFLFQNSLKSIYFEFVIGVAFSLYLVYISVLSPCPPFIRDYVHIGSSLSVFSWCLIECLFIRLRCKIAEELERYGNKILLILGFFTLLGQIVGGTAIFLIVDVYRLLKDKPECVSDFSYCEY
jgi:hypothetical protein